MTSTDIHLALTGKGGVGKSTSMVFLADYLLSALNQRPVCIDTDPVNKSLASFKALECQTHELYTPGTADDDDDEARSAGIDPKRFVELMESIREADAERPIIMDTGATSFIQLSEYLAEYQVFDVIKEETGRNVIVHCMLVGGPAMLDTCQGLVSIADAFGSEHGVVVWRNPYFGALKDNDRKLEEMAFWDEVSSRVKGVVRLPALSPHDKDILGKMLGARELFDEATNKPKGELAMMDRAHLRQLKAKIHKAIETANFL